MSITKRAGAHVMYIDYENEVHTLNPLSCIDPVDICPRENSTIPGVSIKLLDQQTVSIHAIRAIERNERIRVFLPQHPARGSVENPIGEIKTNAIVLALLPGSGKTLVYSALAAIQRVPETRNIILGTNMSNATLVFDSSVAELIPASNYRKLAASMANPFYFTGPAIGPSSYTPKKIRTYKVTSVVPMQLEFFQPHLLEQVKGYYENQLTIPWEVITGDQATTQCLKLVPLLMKMFANPSDESLPHILVLSVLPMQQCDIVNMCMALDKEATKSENGIIKMRIKRFVKEMREPMEDFIYNMYNIMYKALFAINPTNPPAYSRCIFDDYDTMPALSYYTMPALNTIYVSGTSILPGSLDLSIPGRMLFASNARAALTVTILPSKVKDLLKLGELVSETIQCTPNALGQLFFHAIDKLKVMTEFNVEAWKQPKRDVDEIDVPLPPFDRIFTDLKHAYGSNGQSMFLQTYNELQTALSKFGIMLPKISTYKEAIHELITTSYRTHAYMNLLLAIARTIISRIGGRTIEGLVVPYNAWATEFTKNFKPFTLHIKENSSFYDNLCMVCEELANCKMSMEDTSSLKPLFILCDQIITMSPHTTVFLIPYIFRLITTKTYKEALSRNIDTIIDTCKLKLEDTLDKDIFVKAPALRCEVCGSPGRLNITKCCNAILCVAHSYTSFCRTQYGCKCVLCNKAYESNDVPMHCITIKPFHNHTGFVSVIREELSAYIPSCYRDVTVDNMIDKLSIAPSAISLLSTVQSTKDKSTAICDIITNSRKEIGHNPVYLLYNEAVVSAEDFTDTLKQLDANNITHSWFSSKQIAEYATGKYNVIIINKLANITGMNMQFLDGLIYNHPVINAETRTQLVARGMRMGMDSKKVFYEYTLLYPSELQNASLVKYDNRKMEDLKQGVSM